MSALYSQMIALLRRVFLEWTFFKGSAQPTDLMSKFEETAGVYEEVEEVCLRRGQRSRRVVRRLVEEA